MSEISRNHDFDNLLSSVQELETELAALVYDRDKLLYHVCPKLKAEYMLKIGKLENARLKSDSYGKLLTDEESAELKKHLSEEIQKKNFRIILKIRFKMKRNYSKKLTSYQLN